ncbi:unnamed protein product [Fusarium graminearum]|nr:unnamed protein product [Fusarium graminearum]
MTTLSGNQCRDYPLALLREAVVEQQALASVARLAQARIEDVEMKSPTRVLSTP